MSAIMIDTNVLVYRRDRSEPVKLDRADTVLTAISDGHVTAQVLGEYFSVVLRKFLHHTSAEIARAEIETIAAVFTVHPVTVDVVLEAGRGVQVHGLSFYDAQIWAAARLNGVPVVLTEDFCHGRVIEGVRYLNPFCDDFDLSELD
ncbi:MAG: PIN domain nuclease [Actinobacteria bacterium HGW-Actinobacteria-10]|jgi:predicted nucleic acid-binding protein|nr:MAG: PIN domain nuclease [Actinobacteria bacterium HGW-Actinobacteria-10]